MSRSRNRTLLFSLAILALAVSICASSNSDEICAKTPNGFIAAENCKPTYTLCKAGKGTPSSCPDPLVYDRNHKTCTYMETCEKRRTEEVPTIDNTQHSPPPASDFDDTQRAPKPIENGETRHPTEYSSYVEIMKDNTWPYEDTHHCGGVAVAYDWVVTAAHCVENWDTWYGGRNFYLYTNVKTSGVGTLHKIDNVYIHKKFTRLPKLKYDIALVRMATPTDDDSLALMNFEKEEGKLHDCENAALQTIGIDVLEEPFETDPAKNPVVLEDKFTCRSRIQQGLESGSFNKKFMLCGDAKKKGSGSYTGDSGSGIYCRMRDGVVLVGIQSYRILIEKEDGTIIRHNGYPEVYTRISGFSEWIMDTMNDNPMPKL